jgi:hypothetical protein
LRLGLFIGLRRPRIKKSMNVELYVGVRVLIKESVVKDVGYLGDFSRGMHDRHLLEDKGWTSWG